MSLRTAECKGYGCIPADHVFVGINAGRLGALQTRVPLTQDSSGRIFQRMLINLDLSRSDEFSTKPDLENCYVTNLVKCRCLTPTGLNRLPTLDEVEYWRPSCIKEITYCHPRVVVALGRLVFESLSPYLPFGLLHKVNHPRWYQAHGALKNGSLAFEEMLREYSAILTA